MEGITSSLGVEALSVEKLNSLHNEIKGLFGAMRVKGNVDVEKDLENLMRNNEMGLEEKYQQLQAIHTNVYRMIYGDGRASDYR